MELRGEGELSLEKLRACFMMLGFAFNKTFGKKKREQMFPGFGIIIKKLQC